LEEEIAMTKKIALGATLFAVLTLTACNTVDGAGRDLRSAGAAVSDASGQEKPKK
jgi:predicted small secreted protein